MNGSRRSEHVLLYRPSLDLRSGAGQLMHAQLAGLRAAGVRADVACERGALRFWLRAHTRPRRLSVLQARHAASDGDWIVADHGLCVPEARVVFVHNLATEAVRHLPREDWRAAARAEAAFFGELDAAATVVANSRLVARGLEAHFGIGAQRIVVQHPGFDAERFAAAKTAALRAAARKELRLDDATPLVGLVTSGDFEKRGFRELVAAADKIAAERRDARFLVVGSKRLPDWAADHPLARSGRLLHRPKGPRPELWMSALDVFLYPASFEEFGLVVMEALALALPVIATRRVGATECMPEDYAAWILDAPEAAPLADRVLALLESETLRRTLGAAGAAYAARFTRQAYVDATIATLLAQNR